MPVKTPPIAFDWVTIRAGIFTLSKDAGGRTITLPDFRISAQPVTSAQYHAYDKYAPLAEEPDRHMVWVSWDDANAFCEWASKETGQTIRLPTEAEWEKASTRVSAMLFSAMLSKIQIGWEWTNTESEDEPGSYVTKWDGLPDTPWRDKLNHVSGYWNVGFVLFCPHSF